MIQYIDVKMITIIADVNHLPQLPNVHYVHNKYLRNTFCAISDTGPRTDILISQTGRMTIILRSYLKIKEQATLPLTDKMSEFYDRNTN